MSNSATDVSNPASGNLEMLVKDVNAAMQIGDQNSDARCSSRGDFEGVLSDNISASKQSKVNFQAL